MQPPRKTDPTNPFARRTPWGAAKPPPFRLGLGPASLGGVKGASGSAPSPVPAPVPDAAPAEEAPRLAPPPPKMGSGILGSSPLIPKALTWGGPIAAQLAALRTKPIRAAVLYYSAPASLDLVPKLALVSNILLMVAILIRILNVLLLAIVVALAVAPFVFPGAKALNVATKICIFAALVASYDLLLGYTGTVSFAHTMFYFAPSRSTFNKLI
eukprot:gene40258-54440_t